jgi:hypothetical protein
MAALLAHVNPPPEIELMEAPAAAFNVVAMNTSEACVVVNAGHAMLVPEDALA